MIRRLIRILPRMMPIFMIHYGKVFMTDIKVINEKDLDAQMSHPQYFQNTIIILNKELVEFLPSIIKSVKYSILEDQSAVMKGYDVVAINQYRCMLLRVADDSDVTRLQNFFGTIASLPSKETAIELIDSVDARVVMSYIPHEKKNSLIQEQGISELETFKLSHQKDLKALEEQFRELRYLDANRDAQYYYIRDPEVAQQFGLSDNDVGEVYLLKGTNQFNAHESAFLHESKEYSLQKVESEPNTEHADSLKVKETHQSIIASISKTVNKPLNSKQISTKNWHYERFLKRVTLLCNSYVNYVQDHSQLFSTQNIIKQMGVKHLLIYHIRDDDNKAKVIKKLVKLKKSLNIAQQQQIMIILSPNSALLESEFGIVANPIQDTVRLINIQNEKELRFADRHSFDSKFTTTHLREFLFKYLDQPSSYQESTFVPYPDLYVKVITPKDLPNLQPSIIQYYKPGCRACLKLTSMLEQLVTQLQNIEAFKVNNHANFTNLRVYRYNILNEDLKFPSPAQAPQLIFKTDSQMINSGFQEKKIDRNNEQQLLHFLIRFIDQL